MQSKAVTLTAVPGIALVAPGDDLGAIPVIAVSPIIGGDAVKGPTAKIMAELGIAAHSTSIAAQYLDMIDGLLIDSSDSGEQQRIGVPVELCDTMMRDPPDKRRVADAALAFAGRLAHGSGPSRRLTGSTA